jgi:hypothetical protein
MSFSQAKQDIFVINCLKFKKDGFFVEIGGNHPIICSNTYLLEKDYNYKGIIVEMDNSYLPLYQEYRKNSIPIIANATKINYLEKFKEFNVPKNIDYLSFDLDVDNNSTLETLELFDQQLFMNYKFAVVTFEHDIYRKDLTPILNYNSNNTRNKSREIFEKYGYIRVFSDVSHCNNAFEDWYIHPDLIDINYINELIEKNKKHYNNDKIEYNLIEF